MYSWSVRTVVCFAADLGLPSGVLQSILVGFTRVGVLSIFPQLTRPPLELFFFWSRAFSSQFLCCYSQGERLLTFDTLSPQKTGERKSTSYILPGAYTKHGEGAPC